MLACAWKLRNKATFSEYINKSDFSTLYPINFDFFDFNPERSVKYGKRGKHVRQLWNRISIFSFPPTSFLSFYRCLIEKVMQIKYSQSVNGIRTVTFIWHISIFAVIATVAKVCSFDSTTVLTFVVTIPHRAISSRIRFWNEKQK